MGFVIECNIEAGGNFLGKKQRGFDVVCIDSTENTRSVVVSEGCGKTYVFDFVFSEECIQLGICLFKMSVRLYAHNVHGKAADSVKLSCISGDFLLEVVSFGSN